VLGDSERLTKMIAHDWEVSQIDDQEDTQLIRLNLVYVKASSPELQTVHQVLVVHR
jgi:allophanate hydrolase subunit 1